MSDRITQARPQLLLPVSLSKSDTFPPVPKLATYYSDKENLIKRFVLLLCKVHFVLAVVHYKKAITVV